jgi:hypothetical protein
VREDLLANGLLQDGGDDFQLALKLPPMRGSNCPS